MGLQRQSDVCVRVLCMQTFTLSNHLPPSTPSPPHTTARYPTFTHHNIGSTSSSTTTLHQVGRRLIKRCPMAAFQEGIFQQLALHQHKTGLTRLQRECRCRHCPSLVSWGQCLYPLPIGCSSRKGGVAGGGVS